MRELFGEQFTVPFDDSPTIGLMYGSTISQTSVLSWQDGEDALINTRALVAAGPELVPELLRYLLDENADKTFGAFGLDEDGDVIFEHCVLGSSCTREQLRHSVMAVALAGDHYGEEIVSRWGGERARERLERDEDDAGNEA